MAQDKTLSLEERDKLRRNAWMNLIEQPDQDNAIDMSQLVNPSDLQRMYAGHQSLPSAYGRHGFEITVWDSQGSIESPGYKEDSIKRRTRGGKSKKNNHYVFKIPADVFETSGGSSLTMNLEVRLRQ